MQTLYGTIIQLLRDANERVQGFVLDSGEAVHFSVDHPDFGAAFVTLNSRIQITGDLRSGTNGQQFLTSAHFTNLDSNRSASLPAPVRLGKPGMLLNATPNTTASLALPQITEGVTPSVTGLQTRSRPEILGRFLDEVATKARQLRSASTEHPHQHSQPVLRPREAMLPPRLSALMAACIEFRQF